MRRPPETPLLKALSYLKAIADMGNKQGNLAQQGINSINEDLIASEESTEDLICRLQSRCREYVIAVELPTNIREESVLISWSADYYKTLGLAHGIIQDLRAAANSKYYPNDE